MTTDLASYTRRENTSLPLLGHLTHFRQISTYHLFTGLTYRRHQAKMTKLHFWVDLKSVSNLLLTNKYYAMSKTKFVYS